MYFNSPLAWYYSNDNKSRKITPLEVRTVYRFSIRQFSTVCVRDLSRYDSLKIKYAKLQAELSFACAQRPFYSHSSKTSFWILLPTPERGKPANNSKYNMRRQMLQKSVWREATMLRSAREMHFSPRPFWSLRLSAAKCNQKQLGSSQPH